MKLKHLGLGTKFSILTVFSLLLVLVVYFFWSNEAEYSQAENEMLEKAQILSQEMDAMWAFFEVNQHNFVKDERGNYRLYCVIAAKSVSSFFTNDTDYTIHYTNTTTRKPADAPDEFEQAALAALHENPQTTEYYQLTTSADGQKVFRYVRPLYITDSCLECHGEPAGELDPYGFPKEGQQVGDIAGAISITMPIDVYLQGTDQKIVRNAAFTALVVLAGFTVVMLGITFMVTRPLGRMKAKIESVKAGKFDVSFDDIGYHDEIAELASQFDSMTTSLQDLYADLESQVEARTLKLTEANEVLEQQQAKLEEANKLLEESNQFKSDFLAIMSHELRTPLTSIIAFTEVWEQNHAALDNVDLTAIREIQTNGQILLTMVNNILEMARAEAGKLTLVREPVDFVDLVGLVERTLQILAAQRNIELTATIERGVPIIYADWEKLRRILENLTSNALKYTQKGGRVHIHVEKAREHDAVLITVSDTGVGISQEDIDSVFEKFTQADKSSMRRYRGSGLGLAVVKQLVELHGGRIEIQSVRKRGTSVKVTIPNGSKDWQELS